MSAGIIAGVLIGAFGIVTLAFRIPQSSRAIRLQSLRHAGNISYLMRRTPAWMELARAFEVEQAKRLKWEFFLRITPQGWVLSNADQVARAIIPWSAIGSIRVTDDAPDNQIFRNVHLRVTFDVQDTTSELDLYLDGWMWGGYPLSSDPSASPIDAASMTDVARELEGLRPRG